MTTVHLPERHSTPSPPTPRQRRKRERRLARLTASLAAALATLAVFGPASSVAVLIPLHWDGNGTPNDGIVAGGSGTWNTTNTNWTDISGTTNTNWQSFVGIFAGTGGTVNVTENISFVALQFSADGYVVSSTNGSKLSSNGSVAIMVDSGLTTTISAQLAGTSGFMKAGSGTLILTGDNNITGTMQMLDGTLQLKGPSTNTMVRGPLTITSSTVDLLANDQIADTSAVTINLGGRLNTNGFSEHIGSLTLNEGAVQIGTTSPGGPLTVDSLTMQGGLIVGGSGNNRLVLNGNVTAQNGAGTTATIAASVDLGGATRTFTMNPVVAPFPYSLSISGAISNGAIAVDGTGILQLSGTAANTFAGGMFVNSGTVQLGKSAANGAIPGPLTIGDGAGATESAVVQLLLDNQIADKAAVKVNIDGLLNLDGHADHIGLLTLQEGHVKLDGISPGGVLTVDGLDMHGGLITGTGTSKLLLNGDVTATNVGIVAIIAAPVDLNGSRTFTVTNGGLPLNLSISGPVSDGTFIKEGSGTMEFTGSVANTYAGGTFVNDGTLWLNKDLGVISIPGALTIGDGVGGAGTATVLVKQLGQIAMNNPVTIKSDGVFDLNGFSVAVGPVQGAAGSSIKLGSNGVLLEFFNNTEATYAGVISGTGTVVKAGSGTWTLSGANTYGGTTNVAEGTLHTQNASALGTSSVQIGGVGKLAVTGALNVASLFWSGKLQLAPGTGDIVHVAGALNGSQNGGGFIIDTAGLEKSTYTLVTFGSNTLPVGSFSATTLNSNVTLQTQFALASGDGVGSVQMTILGASATGPILQNSAPVGIPTFADFIVDGPVQTGNGDNQVGSLIFQPGSSLVVHDTLTVSSGAVDLPGGSTVTLDGNLSASQFNVLFGALLDGNGSIVGNLTNNGMVSPGHSPGRITVSNNYVQGPTGTLRIEIAGRKSGQFDQLNVGGTASLDGTLQLVRLDNFRLKRGDKIPFLTADGGVQGRFAFVESSFTSSDTILRPEIVYHDRSVALEMVQGLFAELQNLTPNQRAVAGALDRAVERGRADKVIDYLDARRLDKLPGDFDRLAPEELASMFNISTALANVQSINVQRRTDDIRHGAAGFSASGLAMNGTGPGYSGSFYGAAGPTGKESKEAPPTAAVEDKRWGAFLSGVGEWVNVDGDNNARGFNIETGGFTVGVDYKVCPNFAVGLMAGYAGTGVDLNNNGRVWVNGGRLGLYTTTFVGGWYADAAVNGGLNSYDTRRSAIQGDARGSTQGGELNALFGTGYDFRFGPLSVGPTATFNYTLVGIDSFDEHGSLAPLHINRRNEESIRSALGMKATYDWKVGGVLVRPELRAAWQHEYGDTSYGLDATIDGSGTGFEVSGPRLGRDSLLLGAGVAVQLSERCAIYAYYDGELGRTNYLSTNVTGGFRLSF